MAENSKIAWTDHSFNPWWGCVKVSEGCKHCYAETFSKRTGNDIWGVDKPRRFFGDKHWSDPLKWSANAEKAGVRAKVFCASMADVLEDRLDLAEPRKRLADLIKETPYLDWLLCTKRIENAYEMMAESKMCTLIGAPLDNVWLGTTVENQKQADIRIPQLVAIPARIKWLSVEPMLEKIDLQLEVRNYGRDFDTHSERIDWVIVGGESGLGCRPFDWDWARDIRDQCKSADVSFFMKQGGGHPNKRHELDDMPEDLRIREFPA